MRVLAAAAGVALVALAGAARALPAGASCRLTPPVQHVIFIVLHEVGTGDLQQLPSLQTFIHANGTLLVNEHTALSSQATTGLLVSLTGVYPDRFGQPFADAVAGSYWTDVAGDGRPVFLDRRGRTAPAPWVPFTRAGCDVGIVGIPAAGGFAVHCALDSTVCAAGGPDGLADEPGGYSGFRSVPLESTGERLEDVAALQAGGVPVTFAHLDATSDGAFEEFFARLAAAGISQENTLFVFTSDTGRTDPPASLAIESLPAPSVTGSAAAFTLDGRRKSLGVRGVERAAAALSGVTGLADPIGLAALHMVTASPRRTPAFVAFAASGRAFGDDATGGTDPALTQLWAAFAGPGVRALGQSPAWADHADLRPTLLALLGLRDGYQDDGRVLYELLDRKPPAAVVTLAQFFKQLTAPLGRFGRAALRASTAALAARRDATYNAIEANLSSLTRGRNALADQIGSALADPKLTESHAKALSGAAQTILKWADRVAAGSALP